MGVPATALQGGALKGGELIEKTCIACRESLPVQEFRTRTGTEYKLGMCKLCELEAKRMRKLGGREESGRAYPPDPLNAAANEWHGPIGRPFVGICLINARWQINLTSHPKETWHDDLQKRDTT